MIIILVLLLKTLLARLLAAATVSVAVWLLPIIVLVALPSIGRHVLPAIMRGFGHLLDASTRAGVNACPHIWRGIVSLFRRLRGFIAGFGLPNWAATLIAVLVII